MDCRHCGLAAAEPDGALMTKVRDLERKSMHQEIMMEMQKLIDSGVQMDWDSDDDDEPDDLPDLTGARLDYRATVFIPEPSPPQSRQASTNTQEPNLALEHVVDDALRGHNPTPTTAPPTAPCPMEIQSQRMSINLWPSNGVGTQRLKASENAKHDDLALHNDFQIFTESDAE